MKITLFIFVFSISFLTLTAQKKVADLIINDINIIDVENNVIHPHQTVVIDKENIIAIGQVNLIKKFHTKQLIHGTGKYIMPSLWDMHVHFGGDTLVADNKLLLPLYIAMGVGQVRDCAGDISLDVIKWKKAINEGSLLGPTIFTSGPKLEGPKSIWPGDLEIENEAELNTALDSLQKLNVDFIKITDNTLAPFLYLKSIITARKRGWKVTGHVPATLTIETLSNNGLSAIEHIGYLTRVASSEEEKITQLKAEGKISSKEATEQYLKTYDSTIAIKKFKQLAMNGTAVVPTINGSFVTTYLDLNDHKKDTFLKYLGGALKRTYDWRIKRAAGDNAEAIQFRHTNFEAGARLLSMLYKAGVTILAGTDAGYLNSYNYPGLGMHEELTIMVKYGLTPQQALKSSIINGPAFFNLSAQFGSVESGKKAELLILNANPLVSIENTKSIHAVIRKGKYLDRAYLDNLLHQIEKAASDLK